jgi:hypothetical protein
VSHRFCFLASSIANHYPTDVPHRVPHAVASIAQPIAQSHEFLVDPHFGQASRNRPHEWYHGLPHEDTLLTFIDA